MPRITAERLRDPDLNTRDKTTFDWLQRFYPAIFSSEAFYGRTTERGYHHIRTASVVLALENMGLKLVELNQQGNRADPAESQAHYVQLRFPTESENGSGLKSVFQAPVIAGDAIPELMISNSHNGKTAFSAYVCLYDPNSDTTMPLNRVWAEAFKFRHRHSRDLGFVGNGLLQLCKVILPRLQKNYLKMATTPFDMEKKEDLANWLAKNRPLSKHINPQILLDGAQPGMSQYHLYHLAMYNCLNREKWPSTHTAGRKTRRVHSVHKHLLLTTKSQEMIFDDCY